MPQPNILPRPTGPNRSSGASPPQRASIDTTLAKQPESQSGPSLSPGPQSARKRVLIAVACDGCRRRKVKCDGGKPNCSQCRHAAKPCTYEPGSKNERIKLMQERLKDAESEIGLLRSQLADLGPIADRTARTSGSDGSGIAGFSATSSTVVTPGDLTDAAYRPLVSDRSESFSRDRGGLFTGPSLESFHQFEAKLEIPFPSSQDSILHQPEAGGLYSFRDNVRAEIISPRWSLLPMSTTMAPMINEPSFLQYLQCRDSLARGHSLDTVLGPNFMDLSNLVSPAMTMPIHPFAQWVVSYVDSMVVDWKARLGLMYCVFHLLRWLIHPSEENFSHVPAFMKPTGLQLSVPHALWLDFVIFPTLRNTSVDNPLPTDILRMTQLFPKLRISWMDEEDTWTVGLDSSSLFWQLMPEFEAVIRNLDNWFILEGEQS